MCIRDRSINECRRLAIDVAGGLLATIPGDRDFANPEIGGYLEEFFQGVDGVPTRDRARMFKLGHHFFAGGGLVEAKICGAGTSETQRINIYWLANLELKKKLPAYCAVLKKRVNTRTCLPSTARRCTPIPKGEMIPEPGKTESDILLIDD